MFIAPDREFIFVHAPKTGGTALMLALEARAQKNDILIGDTPKAIKRKNRWKNANARGRLWKHSTLADIEGLVDEAFIASAFVFTIVRNPWDRMVSYYHWLRAQSYAHPAVAIAKAKEFGDFVCDPLIAASLSASPFASYVTSSDGVERCDLYLRQGHLAEDIKALETQFNFRLELPERVNTSERRADYQSYYSDAARDAVAEFCGEDIGRFGYGFGDGIL